MKWMSLTALSLALCLAALPVLFSRRETAVQPVTQMEMQQEMKPVTVQQTQQAAPMENSSDDQPEPFRILDRSTGKVQTVPVQVYVTGALCSEMPATFHKEALKAQAVAARTYQVRQMQAAGSRAVLYDVGQAYLSEAEQKEKWGEGYALYAGKIHSAVRATAGEIMTYDGEPILAAFHAQSGGRTEDAAHVWNTAVPYLKSVDSKGDRQAPNNETTVTIAAKALAERLGIAEDAAVSVKKRTEAGYVAEVQAGSKTFSGREIRERLGLRSADFTIAKNGDSYIFTVHGYGHGAGMSQYGASFLAEQGKNYHEILRHYYTGISFSILE